MAAALILAFITCKNDKIHVLLVAGNKDYFENNLNNYLEYLIRHSIAISVSQLILMFIILLMRSHLAPQTAKVLNIFQIIVNKMVFFFFFFLDPIWCKIIF